jgi:hypothetical protein
MGCLSDQQQQLAKCTSDSETRHPYETWLADDARQRYVWLCMAANGYRLNRDQNACAPSVPISEVVIYAQCYQPIPMISRLAHKLETTFRGASAR